MFAGTPTAPVAAPEGVEGATAVVDRVKRALFGAPRDLRDPQTYHTLSLVAFLAWVGLGADGLSSSSYGPEETFRALGQHTYLALALAAANAITVAVISIAYSRIIEAFPFGGGGYVVATRILGPRAGVVSGAALLVDYVLTISVSISSGCDQLFSVLPQEWAHWKLVAASAVLALFVVLNLRGVKESVTFLTPIFALFLLTHAIMIFGGIGSHLDDIPHVADDLSKGYSDGLGTIGLLGMGAIFLRAYSMGGGTYTGIEAVSNGLQIMREPKVKTAKRTMLLMAVSLAICAGGILLGYLLFHVAPEPGKTLNAVLLERFAGGWAPGGVPAGRIFIVTTLGSAAALLFVAAQAGFIDGPRVMANMAHDNWVPHRFGQISDRLSMQNGVILMAVAALATLIYTGGSVTALVTMYSINVFLTFSLSQFAMLRYWRARRAEAGYRRGLLLHGVAFLLCAGILAGTVWEKFSEGGRVTIAVTAAVVGVCFWVRSRYRRVSENLGRLDRILELVPKRADGKAPAMDPSQPTAVLMVGSFSGLGIHALFSIRKLFGTHFRNVVFVGVGVIDSATMSGIQEVEQVRERTEDGLAKFVDLAERLGFAASSRTALATEVVPEAVRLCTEVCCEHTKGVVFSGKLVFEREHWYQRIMHNETAYMIQRELQFVGISCMVLPVRVLDDAAPAKPA
ncbi:MAG: APC family permease [Planctomycetes bacterium]|nr:APC family permease [Planctomycetota bacterium]